MVQMSSRTVRTYYSSCIITMMYRSPEFTSRIRSCLVIVTITVIELIKERNIGFTRSLMEGRTAEKTEGPTASRLIGWAQHEGSAVGTPLQPPTDDDFFRTEATNILKQKDDTLGPNPIRTHFSNGDKTEARRTLHLSEHRRYITGGGRCGHRRYNRRTTIFQDRSHQYVETKGRRPWTEPNTNPFSETGERRPGKIPKMGTIRLRQGGRQPVDRSENGFVSRSFLGKGSSLVGRVKL
jgi:hypothetical protein